MHMKITGVTRARTDGRIKGTMDAVSGRHSTQRKPERGQGWLGMREEGGAGLGGRAPCGTTQTPSHTCTHPQPEAAGLAGVVPNVCSRGCSQCVFPWQRGFPLLWPRRGDQQGRAGTASCSLLTTFLQRLLLSKKSNCCPALFNAGLPYFVSCWCFVF